MSYLKKRAGNIKNGPPAYTSFFTSYSKKAFPHYQIDQWRFLLLSANCRHKVISVVIKDLVKLLPRREIKQI